MSSAAAPASGAAPSSQREILADAAARPPPGAATNAAATRPGSCTGHPRLGLSALPPTLTSPPASLAGRTGGSAPAGIVNDKAVPGPPGWAAQGQQAGWFFLNVDNPGRRGNSGRRRRARQLGEGSAVDREHGHETHARAVDQQVLTVRGQPGIDVSATAGDGSAADQDERAIGVDGVTGDGSRPGVDG